MAGRVMPRATARAVTEPSTSAARTMPMRANRPILACEHPRAEAINAPLARAFSRLGDEDFERRSHFIDGRFENLYLDADQLPGVDDVLAFALARARAWLGSGQATWLEQPSAAEQPLRAGFWVNAMQPGQATSRHAHEECDELVSGVYYVSTPAAAGDILFHDGPFETRLRPWPGLLLLFDPALEHSVERNRGASRRLSIAFNIGPRPD